MGINTQKTTFYACVETAAKAESWPQNSKSSKYSTWLGPTFRKIFLKRPKKSHVSLLMLLYSKKALKPFDTNIVSNHGLNLTKFCLSEMPYLQKFFSEAESCGPDGLKIVF
jgi:hypothetical protein